jgi:hypothetical protein
MFESQSILTHFFQGGGFRVGTSTMYMKAYTTWIEMLKDNGIHAIIMSVKYRK